MSQIVASDRSLRCLSNPNYGMLECIYHNDLVFEQTGLGKQCRNSLIRGYTVFVCLSVPFGGINTVCRLANSVDPDHTAPL